MDYDSQVHAWCDGRHGMDQEIEIPVGDLAEGSTARPDDEDRSSVEGTAFKRISRLDPNKLKEPGTAGIQLIVATLGGAWGATALEERFEFFERAIYGVQQKQDESNDSYLSRHDICFEELLSQVLTSWFVKASFRPKTRNASLWSRVVPWSTTRFAQQCGFSVPASSGNFKEPVAGPLQRPRSMTSMSRTRPPPTMPSAPQWRTPWSSALRTMTSSLRPSMWTPW